MPILAANCVRCHAYPPIGGAPGDCTVDAVSGMRWCGMRLDSYDDTIVAPGVGVRGAASVALGISSRVRDARAPMPPRFPLPDVAVETLVDWSLGDPPDRTPRPLNETPTVAVEVTPGPAASFTLRYQLADLDGDLVVGALHARGVGTDVLIAPIQSGRDELTWDPGALAAGRYDLVARVDDGAGWIELAAGAVTVGSP